MVSLGESLQTTPPLDEALSLLRMIESFVFEPAKAFASKLWMKQRISLLAQQPSFY
ncbi:hypothetical protein VDGD_20721 [Verticillium dahliae]|nr:hypothetical protein VDGD_20721 [Verticillium dahliae]